MENKKKKEIFEYLELEDNNELTEYLEDFNAVKFLNTYEIIKQKTNVKVAIDILDTLSSLTRYSVSRDAIDELLSDDDLIEYLSVNKDSKNKLFIELSRELTNTKISEEDNMDEEDGDDTYLFDESFKKTVFEKMRKYDLKGSVDKECYNVMRYLKYIANLDQDYESRKIDKTHYLMYKELIESKVDDDIKGIPIYTTSEERQVFQKYDYLRMKLELYIYSRRYQPEFENFIEYIDNLMVEGKGGSRMKNSSNDSFITKAMWELYKPKNEEPILRIKKDKTLSDMVEEMREIRDDIVFHNIRLIRSVSKSFANRGLSLEDLDQEGSIGLQKAINKFDVTRGNKFSTYAVNWIRQTVRRAIANDGTTIRLPVHLYERANKIRRAKKILREQEEIEEPSANEIYEKCNELGYNLTLDQIKASIRADMLSTPTSVDKYVGEDEDTSLIEFLTSENTENTEEYAERLDMIERTDKVLNAIAAGKYKTKNENLNSIIRLKRITLTNTNNEEIKIILTKNEYDDVVSKNLPREERTNRLKEFFEKYKIDYSNLTSINAENLDMTNGDREVLIYRYRTGLSDKFSNNFLRERNYNNALFEYDETDDKLTLEEVGKLFGVTRERIRQIETKIGRKVDVATGKIMYKSSDTYNMFIDEKINVYEVLGVSPNNKMYILIVKPNPVATVDDRGNIVTLGETGKAQILLKNAINNNIRELILNVRPSLHESIGDFIARKRLLLNKNEKDNQF